MPVLDPLFAIAEELSVNSSELIRLKAIQKSASLGSTIITRLILGLMLVYIIGILSIALSLYLGEILGKTYLGFLSTGFGFGIITGIAILIRLKIESGLNNGIIRHFFKN